MTSNRFQRARHDPLLYLRTYVCPPSRCPKEQCRSEILVRMQIAPTIKAFCSHFPSHVSECRFCGHIELLHMWRPFNMCVFQRFLTRPSGEFWNEGSCTWLPGDLEELAKLILSMAGKNYDDSLPKPSSTLVKKSSGLPTSHWNQTNLLV